MAWGRQMLISSGVNSYYVQHTLYAYNQIGRLIHTA